MTTRKLILAAGALAAALAAATSAQAVRMDGDGYIDDLQRNPRFIEPYGNDLPSRYREYDFRDGYDVRQAIDQERRGSRRSYRP